MRAVLSCLQRCCQRAPCQAEKVEGKKKKKDVRIAMPSRHVACPWESREGQVHLAFVSSQNTMSCSFCFCLEGRLGEREREIVERDRDREWNGTEGDNAPVLVPLRAFLPGQPQMPPAPASPLPCLPPLFPPVSHSPPGIICQGDWGNSGHWEGEGRQGGRGREGGEGREAKRGKACEERRRR